ncbi:OmpA family protein [Owenweeksia hongkongensis]|uniref:OmpA family protein n=1 Tax=Owenweeksia hongkongensis TaxID=253245 RepID=UPI003A8F16B1
MKFIKHTLAALIFTLNFAIAQKGDSTLVFEINFNLDSYALSKAQKSKVDSVLDLAPISVLKHVEIYGHTDSLAGIEYNRQLSKRRVQSILTYLVYNGLDPLLVDADYYGEERPKYDNAAPTRARNRRVEVHLIMDPSLFPEPDYRITSEKFKKGERIRLPNLNFVGNQPIPVAQSFSVLRDLLEVMLMYPDLQIELQGHVCCNDNYELSMERSKMVHDFLVGNGIDQSRLSYKGFSNKKPLFKEKTEKEKALNRRVEVLVIDNSDRVENIIALDKKLDLRAPVLGVTFFNKKSRLTPQGDHSLSLIAEMLQHPENLYFEFVIFDNINDNALTKGRGFAIDRTLKKMNVPRELFLVRPKPATSRMPDSDNNNFLMVKISEK